MLKLHCRGYSHVYCSLKLDLKLKSLMSTQNIFHTSEFSGRSGSKLVNFGFILNCFGPVQGKYNRVGPGSGHKIYYFLVQSGSGQKITGQYGVGVPKTLPHRTLVCGHFAKLITVSIYIDALPWDLGTMILG